MDYSKTLLKCVGAHNLFAAHTMSRIYSLNRVQFLFALFLHRLFMRLKLVYSFYYVLINKYFIMVFPTTKIATNKMEMVKYGMTFLGNKQLIDILS